MTDPRFHTETFDLARYRLQYSLYKTEAPLQAAHAAHPWIHTFDDHEVENNWAGDLSQADTEPDQDPAVFRRAPGAGVPGDVREPAAAARADAVRARTSATTAGSRTAGSPTSPSSTPASTASTSRAATATRRPATTGSTRTTRCSAASSASGCWTGSAVERPLAGDRQPDPDGPDRLDPRPGDARLARPVGRLCCRAQQGARGGAGQRRPQPGGHHRRPAPELRARTEARLREPGLAHGRHGVRRYVDHQRRRRRRHAPTQGQQFLAANPHLKFFNSQRGYVRVTVDQHRWRSDFRVVPYVSTPGAPITTRATYVVEDRSPHVHAS